MSIFTSIATGVDKAAHFLISVFTKTEAVVSVVSKVSPKTLAVILAVFYDLAKFIAQGGTVAADIASGNFAKALADAISPTTQALIVSFEDDVKAADATIVEDLKELGIAFSTTTPAA